MLIAVTLKKLSALSFVIIGVVKDLAALRNGFVEMHMRVAQNSIVLICTIEN